jgi:type IV pilus assembly protein PilM
MGSQNFYRDEPLFGLDIGYASLKVMQIEAEAGGRPRVLGYGTADFPPHAILNGVIGNFELLGKAMYQLFKSDLHGAIYTRRVACALPTSHTFNRMMKIPDMPEHDVRQAIELEAEQYIPMPLANLYIDYDITSHNETGIELLMVATPKAIVDSYMELFASLDLEPVALEPSVNAASRLFGIADAAYNEPSVLIDFGSIAIDLAVFDKTMIVNSTLAGGGKMMTKLIADHLKVDENQAHDMKNKYGIGASDKQQKVAEALAPMLDGLVKEIRKIMRYYNERVGESDRQIAHIITAGGGANMPGINQYLSKQLGLPAKTLDPWPALDFGRLPKLSEVERSAYLTAAGEAIVNPKEILA